MEFPLVLFFFYLIFFFFFHFQGYFKTTQNIVLVFTLFLSFVIIKVFIVLKNSITPVLARLRNFGHLVYNQRNCIIFYWYFYTEWETAAK